jgi:hypothetical protein
MGLVGESCPAWHAANVVLAVAAQFGDASGAPAFVAAVFPVWSFRRDDTFARRVGALRGAVHWGALPPDTLRLGMEGGKSVIGPRYDSCKIPGPVRDLPSFCPEIGCRHPVNE